MSRTIVITGASSGIGANAAGRLARDGWDVAVVGRNAERTTAVAAAIGATAFVADYDSLDEVRRLAASIVDRYPRIDVLANNAGGLVSKRGLSADGHERTFQHNHLAPFLLTTLLMPMLIESSGRVIGTSSVANRFGDLRLDDLNWTRRRYLGGWRAYGTSKVATILFARSLAARNIEAYSFHPGYVATGFGADSALVRFSNLVSGGRISISAEEGATPLVQLASAETVDAPNGSYFDGLKPGGAEHRIASQPGVADHLWTACADMVGI